MAEFVSYLIVDVATAIYLSWTIAYFFCPLFSIRFKFGKPFLLIFLMLVPLMTVFQILRPNFMLNTANFQFQIMGFLFCLALFQGAFIKKTNYYLFYMIIEYTVELMAANIFVFLHNCFSHAETYSVISMYEICSPGEALFVLSMNVLFGILFFRKAVSIMCQCEAYLRPMTTFQILLPLFAPAVLYGFMQARFVRFSPVFQIIFYWLVCAVTLLILPIGIKNVRQKQLEYIRDQSELQMISSQLEASGRIQEEYVHMKKWNHDIQNHLIAFSYLMDMRRYPEALHYCEKILSGMQFMSVPEEGDGHEM